MSRVGKLPVEVPAGVEVSLKEGEIVIKGKLGELRCHITGDVKVTYNAKPENNEKPYVEVQPANETKKSRSMWGTTRNLIKNMVKGVSEGYEVTLEVNGVGYRAALNKNILTLTLGYSHEIKYAVPSDVKVVVDKQTTIILSGADKQRVGQIAAELMRLRKVEPYKGKGVYEKGSYIRRKEGKKK